jgi:CheY-like chemotaxis protein
VLVCDDEPSIRALIVRVLQRAGFRTLEAGDGREAFALIEDRSIIAVLTDHHMAGMSGAELYQRTVAVRPDLAGRFLLMSGDAGDAELRAFAAAANLRILPKPFELTALPATVSAVVAG